MFNKRLIQRLTSAISYHTCTRFELAINMNINYRRVNIIQNRGNYLRQNYLKLIECDSRKSYIELLKILTDFNINFLPILYRTCELLQLHDSYYIITFFIFQSNTTVSLFAKRFDFNPRAVRIYSLSPWTLTTILYVGNLNKNFFFLF